MVFYEMININWLISSNVNQQMSSVYIHAYSYIIVAALSKLVKGIEW